MSTGTDRMYKFGRFTVDVPERLLLSDGDPVQLPPKVFDTLVILVESKGRLVEKDELMTRLWPDSFVEEATLARNISNIRRALGETASEQKYIETVPKHGYRFIASVVEINGAAHDLVIERHTRSRIVTHQEVEDEPMPAPALPEASGAMPLAQIAGGSVVADRRSLAEWRPLAGGRPRILLIGILLAAAVSAAYLLFFRFRTTLPPMSETKVIAVLPFAPISSEGRDEFLELGMADALITNLSSLGRIVVRPTSSVRRYAGFETDPVKAGRELMVDAVLEGSVQRIGDRVRVTARLLRVKDSQALWSGEFDEKSSDIFRVQDRISDQIARALALRLTGEEKKLLAKRYTEDSEAYDLYQKGRFFWNKRTEDNLNKGIQYFRQAIDRDSNYALAYAGLADSYALLDLYSVQSPNEIFSKARAAAETAIRLDDTLAEAHASLAYVKYYHDWDWSGAEAEFRRAIAADPNYATAHQWYSEYLFYMARFDESIAEINRAHELDPFSLAINTELGSPYYYMRQYDTALEKYRAAREMDGSFYLASYCTALCYGQKGMFKEAIGTLGGGGVSAAYGYFYAMSGRTAEARHVLAKLIGGSKHDAFASAPGSAGRYRPVNIAWVLTGLGEKDRALDWLAKGVEDKDERVVMLKVDPHFDTLRGDGRYQELLRRVGLL